MAKQSTATGKNLKEQIKEPVPDYENEMMKEIHQHFLKTGITAVDILGELVWPYAGMRCPAIWSIADAPGVATDKILAALMVHFSSKENLSQLPEDLRSDTPSTLHYLYMTMETIGKYGNLLFTFANLYHSKQGRAQSNELNDELKSNYG